MHHPVTRREFLGGIAVAAGAPRLLAGGVVRREPLFRISLAEWSLHRALFEGRLSHLDFPRTARVDFGLDAVEYVNTFFKDKARDADYLRDLRRRCSDHGVRSLLIMCDGEGDLGAADPHVRTQSVENHHKWVEAAAALECHSIRCNAASTGTREEQRDRAADGLRRLTEYGDAHGINVIVENHGGLSSDGAWLAEVIRAVDHPRCGTLPDFGNFCLDWERAGEPDAWYDRYRGVREMMPFAKAVSAKSHAFDKEGNETSTDYRRMLKIVLDSGYRGYIGVEYEGDAHPEPEGVRQTMALLERVRAELAG